MNDSSMDMEYAAIEANARLFNKTQTNPLNLPDGFFLVESPKGDPLGFGFYCPKCKIHFPGHAPEIVKHCGKASTLPPGMNDPTKVRFTNLKSVKNWLRFWRLLSSQRTVVVKTSSHA
jgi:hypothetical protein